MTRLILVFLTVFAIGLMAKRVFFPSDQILIQRQLNEIAQLLTKPKGESVLATAQKISKTLDYVHPPVTVSFNKDPMSERTISQQDQAQLRESVSGFRFQHPWVNVKFQEIVTRVNGDAAESATTVRLEFNTADQGDVYDLYAVSLGWRKVNGQWLIQRLDIKLAERDL